MMYSVMLWSRLGLSLPLKGWLERKVNSSEPMSEQDDQYWGPAVRAERRESSQGNLEKLGKVSSSRWIWSLKE